MPGLRKLSGSVNSADLATADCGSLLVLCRSNNKDCFMVLQWYYANGINLPID
jgi:hypothetical protein